MIIEAAEASGIPRGRLALDATTIDLLTDAGRRVEWRTLAELIDRVFELVGNDPERMRSVGRLMIRVPSNQFLQKLASRVVSLRSLYVAGNRWLAPALFPGVQLKTELLSPRRIRISGSLAPSYRDCLGFFYLAEGNIAELPRLMGAPPATIERSEVTPRAALTELLLPPRERLFVRGRRFLSPRATAEEELAIVEDQQREIQRGLEAITSASENGESAPDRWGATS
jgi:hypothetical protein